MPDLKPLRVGVTLSGLAQEEAHQPDLFDKPSDARLVTAIDEVNAKFGKGAITYGAAAAKPAKSLSKECRRRRSCRVRLPPRHVSRQQRSPCAQSLSSARQYS